MITTHELPYGSTKLIRILLYLLSFTDESDMPLRPLPAGLPATGVTSTLKSQ
jgi:hypothetical protein